MTHSTDAIASRRIPADFVIERAILSPAQVALGLAQGWIDANDVVAIATSAVAEPTAWADDFTELACLSACNPENQWRVPAMLSGWPPDADDVAVWKYLAVAHVFESRAHDPDWMETGALVVDDFGSPDDMRSLLPWTPAPVGTAGGIGYLEECYRSYLGTLRRNMDGVLRQPGPTTDAATPGISGCC